MAPRSKSSATKGRTLSTKHVVPIGPARDEIDNFELTEYTPFLINRVAATTLRRSADVFHRHGFTVSTFRILSVLRQKRSCRVGELAEITCIELPSLSRYLSELSGDGLIRRRRDPDDSRSVIVTITPAGRSRIEELLPSALVMGRQILADLSEAEIRVLRQILQKIYGNLQRFAKTWDVSRKA